MQKFLLIIATGLFLASCSMAPAPTPMEQMQISIEAQITEKMHNPKSFEFVSLEITDTINKVEALEATSEELYSYVLEWNQKMIQAEIALEHADHDILKDMHKVRIANLKESRDMYLSQLEELDRKKKTTNAEHISEIVTKYTYRSTNASGAIVKNRIQVKFNDTLGISDFKTFKS